MTYIQPLLPVLIVVFAAGTFLAWRRSKSGAPVLLMIGIIGLFLLSWLPFARMVERPFEAHFPPRVPSADDAQAIVVISGGMMPPDPVFHQRQVETDTYARCVYAAWLYLDWRQLPVLASGGPPRGRPHETPDAAVMATVLRNEGVPAPMIWLEQRSISTHQNASYSAAILRARHIQNIVLVTSAFHMLRAEKCFRKEGLSVTAAACDYRTYAPYDPKDFFPSWEGVRMSEDVLHEVFGLFWYWLHGWV